MMKKVIENLTARYHEIGRGVLDIMGGKVLEYEAKTIRNQDIEIGRIEGIFNSISLLLQVDFNTNEAIAKVAEPFRILQDDILDKYGYQVILYIEVK